MIRKAGVRRTQETLQFQKNENVIGDYWLKM